MNSNLVVRSVSRIVATCAWLSLAAAGPLRSQLAITEVMSSASTNLGFAYVTPRADFWELTNFGTNAVDLNGCCFSDSAGIEAAAAYPFTNRTLGPGKSIVFVQETPGVCTNAAQFRAWWGEANLPPDLEICFYTSFGFSSQQDAVQLWRFTATSTTLVQRVELFQARRGLTFTYDPVTGQFDRFSVSGQDGAFKAVETDDVGSPGFTVGPVPLLITEQPQGQAVDAGTPVNFRVRATGLPNPQCQWRFNGTNMDRATSDLLTIPSSQPGDAGIYTVGLDNGVERRTSTAAELQVNTTPSPARIVTPPTDLSVTPGQTAIFCVEVRGYELPTFQWRFSGVNLPGATNRCLSVVNVTSNSAGTYSVRVQNSLAVTNAAAVLSVRPKPNLVITEMMGSPSTNTAVPGHDDWWELTNFDTNAVELSGYRFDDFPGVMDGAPVITNAVIIQPDAIFLTNRVILQPNETMIFLRKMTPEAFACWWGERNLPERVQFVCYAGNGFDFTYDSITVWNATATDIVDFVARAEYVNLNPDFTPVLGNSLNFWCGGWIEFGQTNLLGQCGAVRAAEADDIGSPGFIADHPPRAVPARPPRCLQIFRDSGGVHLTWQTQCERLYQLQVKDDLTSLTWAPVSLHSASGPRTMTTVATPVGRLCRFYRLVVVSGPL